MCKKKDKVVNASWTDYTIYVMWYAHENVFLISGNNEWWKERNTIYTIISVNVYSVVDIKYSMWIHLKQIQIIRVI